MESFKLFTFPVNYSQVTVIKELLPSPLTSSVSFSVRWIHCGCFELSFNITYRADISDYYERGPLALTTCP